MKEDGGYLALRRAIRQGALSKFPKKEITLAKLQKGDMGEQNCFHYAALCGIINDIPQEFLSLENLNIKTKRGETCFHLAGLNGHLDQIPQEFLTEENLRREDNDERNTFHYAALGKNLHKLPSQFLIPENLLKSNKGKDSPLITSLKRIGTEKDILKMVKGIPTRMWVPYVKELRELKKRKNMRFSPTIIKLVEEVEALQKVKEMGSLKITL